MANNRVQQRFDRSIREAVEDTKRANDRKPRRDLSAYTAKCRQVEQQPKGRLYLCPETGATIWEPSADQTAEQ